MVLSPAKLAMKIVIVLRSFNILAFLLRLDYGSGFGMCVWYIVTCVYMCTCLCARMEARVGHQMLYHPLPWFTEKGCVAKPEAGLAISCPWQSPVSSPHTSACLAVCVTTLSFLHCSEDLNSVPRACITLIFLAQPGVYLCMSQVVLFCLHV